MPRCQRWHELETGRHRHQRHLSACRTCHYEWIISHHPAQAASALCAGRGAGGESAGAETGSFAAGGRRAAVGSRAGVRAGRATLQTEKIA